MNKFLLVYKRNDIEGRYPTDIMWLDSAEEAHKWAEYQTQHGHDVREILELDVVNVLYDDNEDGDYK